MNETVFENMAEELKSNIAKDIAYTYSVFVPQNTENLLYKMKSNILLTDRKYISKLLKGGDKEGLIFPCDVLEESIERHIKDFYNEFELSVKTSETIAKYGDRATLFKRRFAENVEKMKKTAKEEVFGQLNFQIVLGKDAKSVINSVDEVLSKQINSLKNFLRDSAGQLEGYMLLWDWYDMGFIRYRFRTVGGNCKKCDELDGKIFAIDQAEFGVNIAPQHYNCNCATEILDDAGNVVFTTARHMDKDEQNRENGVWDYLKTSLKQIIYGNFTDDVNLLGTLGQVALGLLGLDLPADIRDLLYDISNFKLTPEHAFQTLLDVLALLPVIGGVKYVDEAGEVLKAGIKKADEATDAIKAAVKPSEDAAEAAKNTIKITDVNLENNSESVNNFIRNNVNSNFQQNVREAFADDAKVTVLSQDTMVYRYHGGMSTGESYWYTPKQTTNPAADLALPPGNTYDYMDVYVVPKGTVVLEGTVAPNFGQAGGGYQFYISNPKILIKKQGGSQ